MRAAALTGGLAGPPMEATVCAEAGPGPRWGAATGERDRFPKGRGRILVDPLTATDEQVVGLDSEQPPRRRQPEQRRDAKPLSRRAVVLRSTDRIGADQRPLLRVPEGDLMPPAAAQERQDLEPRPRRGLLGKLVVWDAELLGEGTAVTAVSVEQLHNAGWLAELTRAPQRFLVGYRIDQPDAPLRCDGVRRPLHEAWLGRDPAEREAELIDEANAAHATDGTLTGTSPHATTALGSRAKQAAAISGRLSHFQQSVTSESGSDARYAAVWQTASILWPSRSITYPA